MGKPTGFLETDRAPAPRRPIALRVHDWREVGDHEPEADARAKALEMRGESAAAGWPVRPEVPPSRAAACRARPGAGARRACGPG